MQYKDLVSVTVFLVLIVCTHVSNASMTQKQHEIEEYAKEQLSDCEYNAKAGNFFERSAKRKRFEYFEHGSTMENLTFLATQERLDPKLHGGDEVGQDAKDFFCDMRTVIAKKLQMNYLGRNDIRSISKHAELLCNQCAELELLRRSNKNMGTVKARATFLALSSYNVNGQKFYEIACGDTFKSLSDEKLASVIEKTKPPKGWFA